MKSSIAIVALVVASVGLAIPASAQSASASSDGAQIGLSLDSSAAPPPPVPGDGNQIDLSLGGPTGGGKFLGRAGMPGGEMGPAAIMALACSPQGTEALDVALLRLSYRLNLTADQKPLFDAFREKALTTETSFADTCKADQPGADAKPDLLVRLKVQLTTEQARLTALNDILPSFEAFYNSLTDAQKASLMPDRHARMGDHPRWDRAGRPQAPGRN